MVSIVFSDNNMPGMSGWEMLGIVKIRFPHLQVSMISAYGDACNYQKIMNSTAKEIFTKPVEFKFPRKVIGEV